MANSRREVLSASAALGAAALLTPDRALGADKFGRDRDWSGKLPVSYPEPGVEVLDKRFAKYKIGNANIERIATGCRWAEGTCYMRDWGCLLWSDIPNNRIMRWTEETGAVSVYRQPSNFTNGNTRDRQGRLISCEHDARRVTRTEHDGRITVLADKYDGKPLNAPNDAAVTADGALWFTDPGYGILLEYEGHKAKQELPPSVYRLDPSGKLTAVATDFVRPNGLCFSPDEKKLYVADTGASHTPGGPRHIRVFDVDGGRLGKSKVFADFSPGFSDGIRCDMDGNVWASWGWGGLDTNGVRVHAPNGDRIGMVHLPEICGNLSFGGTKRNRLFMAGSTSIYAVYVEAIGAMLP
jgi:gluconolactonase